MHIKVPDSRVESTRIYEHKQTLSTEMRTESRLPAEH